MPNYQFECSRCKENFELAMSMKERGSARIACPKCKGDDVTQQYSGLNIIVKKAEKKCPNESACGGCRMR